MNQREQAITTIVPDKPITITCTIIDGKEHFTAQINRTGELFKCPPEVAGELVPIMVAMEQEIRNELSALSEPGWEAPVEAKALTADRIMEVVRGWVKSYLSTHVFDSTWNDLRSRLSELGLK